MTQHQTIINYLLFLENWCPSYRLSKFEFKGEWVGSRGERSARDLTGEDCPKGLENRIEREMGDKLLERGIKMDAFDKPIEKKYAYYCAVSPRTWEVWKTPDGVIRRKIPIY